MSEGWQDRREKVEVPPREELLAQGISKSSTPSRDQLSAYRPPWTFKMGRPVREMATSWRERRWNMTVTRGVGAKARDPRAELMARDLCMASERVWRDQRRGEAIRGG